MYRTNFKDQSSCPMEKYQKANTYYFVPLLDPNTRERNGKLLRVKVGSKVDEMIQNMCKLNYNTDPTDNDELVIQ